VRELLQDVRFALRQLRKNPAYTVAATVMLAVAICANGTVFSWIDGTMLHPIPGARDMSSLVSVMRGQWNISPTPPFSYLDYRDLRDQNQSFDGITAYHHDWLALTGGDRPERIYVANVAANNLGPIPSGQRTAAEAAAKAKEAPEFDRRLDELIKTSPIAAWALTHGMFVTSTSSPRAYVAATLEYHLRNGIAEQISCPTLVLDAEEDMFFKGQPEELYEHLTCPKTFMRFTAAEGAGAHCQVGAQRLAFGRIYDWVDDTLRHVA